MGLLNRQAGKPGPMGMPMTQPPPQMGQMGRGMPGAFGGNPAFMAQLQQMMQRQPFTAPRVGMPVQPGQPAGGITGGADPGAGYGMASGFGGPGPMGTSPMAFRPQIMPGGNTFDMFGERV